MSQAVVVRTPVAADVSQVVAVLTIVVSQAVVAQATAAILADAASPNDVAFWPSCVLVALRRSAVHLRAAKQAADVPTLVAADVAASQAVVVPTPVAADVAVSPAVAVPMPVVVVASLPAVAPAAAVILAVAASQSVRAFAPSCVLVALRRSAVHLLAAKQAVVVPAAAAKQAADVLTPVAAAVVTAVAASPAVDVPVVASQAVAATELKAQTGVHSPRR